MESLSKVAVIGMGTIGTVVEEQMGKTITLAESKAEV
jgi:hypothetical protein